MIIKYFSCLLVEFKIVWSVNFKHLFSYRTEKPRNKGGLGKMEIPLVSDLTKQISKDYGILIDEAGISLR